MRLCGRKAEIGKAETGSSRGGAGSAGSAEEALSRNCRGRSFFDGVITDFGRGRRWWIEDFHDVLKHSNDRGFVHVQAENLTQRRKDRQGWNMGLEQKQTKGNEGGLGSGAG